jgi:hypothetical protein
MTQLHLKQALYMLKIVAFFGMLFALYYYLFYKSIYICPENFLVNLNRHVDITEKWLTDHYVLPHPGFHIMTLLTSWLTGLSLVDAALVIHTLFTVLTIFIVYKILGIYLKSSYPDNFILLLTACAALVIAIYVPGFSLTWYLGQGNPNMIYSVTLTVVKPFMLLCIIFFLLMIKAVNSKTGGALKYGALLSATLLISVFMKPSFALVFIPAYAIYLLLKHTWNIKLYIYSLAIVLPSLIALLWQSYGMFITPEAGYKPIFEIRPFEIWNTVTRNIPASILLAVAFPLVVTLLDPRKAFENNGLVLSWLMVIMGIVQYALLLETTAPSSYNWIWGYCLALLPLFIFSIIGFLGPLKDMWHKSALLKSGIILASVIFLLHVASGVAYLAKMINCGSFM